MSDTTHYITLTDATFESEVLASSIPVLVDFWTPWCGPCRMISPMIEALAVSFAGQAKVAKLNIDDYVEIARQYGIQAAPTLLFFQDGQVVDQVVGVVPKQQLVDKLNTLLQPQATLKSAA